MLLILYVRLRKQCVMNPKNEPIHIDLFDADNVEPTVDMSDAVYASCLLVIERMRDRLKHLDDDQFPTEATKFACDLLLNTLTAIEESININRPSPHVVYERLVNLRNRVLTLERSNSTLVSWPIACWFEQCWKTNISDPRIKVFFVQCQDHNYSILNFTNSILQELQEITTEDVRKKLADNMLFCISLASLEEDNVPLYASIAHEFGHIVSQIHSAKFDDIIKTKLDPVTKAINASLLEEKTKRNNDIGKLLPLVFYAFAEELISDAFAATLMGPSFILSMNEISWAVESTPLWHAWISKTQCYSNAHPSMSFRLNCLESILKYSTFREGIDRIGQEFNKQGKDAVNEKEHPNLRTESYGYFIRHYNPTKDKILIDGYPLLQKLIEANWQIFTRAFFEIATESFKYFRETLSKKDVFIPDPAKIFDLLQRLAHEIPPNIIEDITPLGQPADVPSIILTACLYRQKLFAEATSGTHVETMSELSKLDRLTSKAIESTFVQSLYNEKIFKKATL
jgi:hypothetical protein